VPPACCAAPPLLWRWAQLASYFLLSPFQHLLLLPPSHHNHQPPPPYLSLSYLYCNPLSIPIFVLSHRHHPPPALQTNNNPHRLLIQFCRPAILLLLFGSAYPRLTSLTHDICLPFDAFATRHPSYSHFFEAAFGLEERRCALCTIPLGCY
jgi:hypothetical protein